MITFFSTGKLLLFAMLMVGELSLLVVAIIMQIMAKTVAISIAQPEQQQGHVEPYWGL